MLCYTFHKLPDNEHPSTLGSFHILLVLSISRTLMYFRDGLNNEILKKISNKKTTH